MSLAWIASYPKSGNTWTRILLSSYLRDERVRATNGEVELDGPVPAQIDLFARGRLLPLDSPTPIAVKTHFMPGVDIHRPYREATTHVVYLVRNPRDVIHSGERHINTSPRHRKAFAEHFIEHRGALFWEQNGWGTWPSHVREWTTPEELARHFPNAGLHVLRYEDLKADTVGALCAVLEFLGFAEKVDLDRAERAVRNSSLDTMRTIERGSMPSDAQRNLFFGSGLSGQSLADYGPDVEEAYLRLLAEDEQFAQCVRRFGYTDRGPDGAAPGPVA